MNKLLQKLNHLFTNKKGVSSVEFTLTVGFFFTVVFLIFEFGRIALLSAYWDLAVSEGIRLTKSQPAPNGDYAKLLKQELIKQHQLREGNNMALFMPENVSIDVTVNYADSIDDLIKGFEGQSLGFRPPQRDSEGNLIPPTGVDAAIANYHLEYKYKFLIGLPFLGSVVDSLFTRDIVMVQEYERTQFKEK
ncbi:pilus assembly protein [Pasteurella skyensis]|uniref:Pilus assembly protein n=1 Tax=Phocoenobacter skyensis TaxID=97481 RepID=A0AAJ6NDS5_9PAST|nr:TadE family protein [Pasteurella skyensis]MDP8170829.1 pilus assembly protein [Pasteurella skyensis]MDP8174935.1 pilus assembly protein [Pasteurella skyensis]